jgi:Peptidase C13 family
VGRSGPFRERPDQRAIQFEERRSATIETLAMSLQAAANGMDAENDVLFLILTSHGSPAGLAVKAGRLTQTLTPSKLADMLAWTGVRHKVVVISACFPESLSSSCEPQYARNHRGRCRPSVVRLPG